MNNIIQQYMTDHEVSEEQARLDLLDWVEASLRGRMLDFEQVNEVFIKLKQIEIVLRSCEKPRTILT